MAEKIKWYSLVAKNKFLFVISFILSLFAAKQIDEKQPEILDGAALSQLNNVFSVPEVFANTEDDSPPSPSPTPSDGGDSTPTKPKVPPPPKCDNSVPSGNT